MHKILVVEDDTTLREVYEVILSTGPYVVETASNGKEALDRCAECAYDLILLDLMMPIMDGIGFLKHFITSDAPTPAKVVILSNLSSGEELEQAQRLGAYRNYLKSDLSPNQLLRTVRSELEVVAR